MPYPLGNSGEVFNPSHTPFTMVQSASINSASRSGKGMLVVIDPSVKDYDSLAQGVLPGAEVLVLDGEEDAIAQITTALRSLPVPFSSLHLVVPGAPGALHFTSGELSLKTMKGYVEQLQTWFSPDPESPASVAMVLEPRLLLYGCRIGVGQAGTEFIDTLSWLTGATVSASKTQIGRGNWILEGQDAADLAFTPATQRAYEGVLA